MIELFRSKKIHTDEDYRRFLKNKSKLYLGFSVLGLILGLAIYVAVFILHIEVSERISSFYAGISGAFICIGPAMLLKNRRIAKNPKLLRKARIQHSDERNEEILSRSLKLAGYIQFFGVYVMLLAGIFIDEILVTAGMWLVFLFFVVYLGSYFILNKKL